MNGIGLVIELAARDQAFAEALLSGRKEAIESRGIQLTVAEWSTLSSISNEFLLQTIQNFRSGNWTPAANRSSEGYGGIRADLPPRSFGIQPDLPPAPPHQPPTPPPRPTHREEF